ncbi:hypothetical protein RFI_04774 [Reticulomyxa filosa]|uniref:Uncharacterized protein n=1 Tax=Reticulomyxa filosa TaxID=46433 RepID=X6P2H9_RETFI|nr:hypothetical protein RFI_04774 [Reticulomyxa filosa]|eukprot:ETO32343.1 hypothetical protein RFI_04774 [Reticulomyxa filosa]
MKKEKKELENKNEKLKKECENKNEKKNTIGKKEKKLKR